MARLSDTQAWTVTRVPAHGLFIWLGLLSVAAGSERERGERVFNGPEAEAARLLPG